MMNSAARIGAARYHMSSRPQMHRRLPLTVLTAVAILCGALAGNAVARSEPAPANPSGGEPAIVSHATACQAATKTRAVADTPFGGSPLSPTVIHALCAASVKTQADPFLLLAIAWQESRFDPTARNRFSSARGLLQFTTTTWLTVIHDFGARYGLTRFAAAIRTDRDGRIRVTSPALRQRILTLRSDPELEAIMAAEWLAQQKITLEQEIGRPATTADLYLLHLLGPAGAKDFLARLAHNPKTPSIDVVGHVTAETNIGLFMQDGRRLSLAETYKSIQESLNQQVVLHADLFTPSG